MTTSYFRSFKLGLMAGLAFPIASHTQSLEDKVSQVRQSQTTALRNVDPVVVDSLVREKKRLNLARSAEMRPSDEETEQEVLDSLLAGPEYGINGQLVSPYDTSWMPDSLSPDGRPRSRRPIPKRYEQRIFQSVDKTAFSSASGAGGRDQVLGPGDGLVLSVWGEKEKQYFLTANREGAVFVEGVGLISVAGFSVAEAELRIKERLARIYSGISRNSTFVNLALGKAGPRKVFVLGEVLVPGGYVFSGQASVLTAMYLAQGPTNIGTVRNLLITRNGKQHPIDLYAYLMKGETPSLGMLQDGDIIFAGRAQALVEIAGDVGRPATFEMKTGESIADLIAFAGGLNATAASQKMTLQRVFPDGRVDYADLPAPQEFLSGKARIEFRDGDKVLVEKSSEKSVNFITVSGSVKYPGTYEASELRTVKQLIEKAGGLQEEAYLGRVHVVRFNPDGSSRLFAYSVEGNQADTLQLKGRDNVILYSQKDMYLPDSVEIAGAVFKPARYEFRQGMTVKDLVMQAGGFLPHHEQGKVLVFRGEAHGKDIEQLNVALSPGLGSESAPVYLRPSDFVQVPIDPNLYRKEIISLEGLFQHPGKYSLLYPGEKLASLIQRAGGFKPSAYIEGGRFFRTKDSIGRVGVDILAATKRPRSNANIPLAGGDSIFIPERSNTVKVIGEVGFETSVLVQQGATAMYYIDRAGGFTRRSEKGRVMVQYANGEASKDGYFNRKPDAGSVIYVPRGPEPKPIEWLAGTSALLQAATLAVALLITAQSLK